MKLQLQRGRSRVSAWSGGNNLFQDFRPSMLSVLHIINIGMGLQAFAEKRKARGLIDAT